MSMRLHQANASTLLRRTGADHCAYCGTPVEWFDRYDTQRIPLTVEVPSRHVPVRFRWHVDKGIAYPGEDARAGGHCRLPHPTVCPALDHTDLPEELVDVVRRLAVRMRARVARGEFTPQPPPEQQPPAQPAAARSGDAGAAAADRVRHTLHYSTVLLLAPCRIEDVRCVAALEDGERCPEPIFAVEEGAWERVDVPYAPGREGQTILSRTGGTMWVWSLRAAGFTTVSRWWKQRCTSHDDVAGSPDQCPREWVEFHPLRHSEHIVTDRPQGYDLPPAPADDLTVFDGPRERTRCAESGCSNATVAPVPADWRCWQCVRQARRRAAVHRRRQNGPAR
ncbi:DUF6083 domain-containing protein [Streptomyces sp. NPDC059740]|uniref:DUF6083 domain-containing protein n=1 Tax=Streptomyces sp. NPDC059740 TaxID=3346926 RepID=UPI0036607C3B